MNKKEPLKPCPFCGEIPKLKDFSTDEYYPGYAVQCINDLCPCRSGSPILTKKEAITAWNTRQVRKARGE